MSSVCALVLETGEAREVHHFALLIGYGAGAVNPYLAFESIEDMIAQGELQAMEADRFAARFFVAKVRRYAEIVRRDRVQAKFLAGWINRSLDAL